MTGWFTVNGAEDADLARTVERRERERLQREKFLSRDVLYVSRLWRPVVPADRTLKAEATKKLRELCRTSEVSILTPTIRSHRKILGPFIVRTKRLVSPIIQQFLKTFLERQKLFNKTVVEAYAELASEPRERTSP